MRYSFRSRVFNFLNPLNRRDLPITKVEGISALSGIMRSIRHRQSLLEFFREFSSSISDFQPTQLHHAVNRAHGCAELLICLRNSLNIAQWLLAYQVVFELAENASQKLRANVGALLPPRSEFHDLTDILTRKKLLDRYLLFLFKNNYTDVQIIATLKETLDSAKIVVHSSVCVADSFMFAGTGDDNFYRLQATWFSNGRKWAQFTTTAVGAVHIRPR
jgi:26S proteasome regulatory subunit N2